MKVINDERVKYEVLDCTEPSHVSSINSDGYSIIKHTTQQLFPDAIPIPGLSKRQNKHRMLLYSLFSFLFFRSHAGTNRLKILLNFDQKYLQIFADQAQK